MNYNNTTLRRAIFTFKYLLFAGIALSIYQENYWLAGLLFCVGWIVLLLSTFQYFWKLFRRA